MSKKLYKLISKVCVSICSLLLLSGCGKQFTPEGVEKPERNETENLIVVGVSQVGSESVWRTANTESVQKELNSRNGFFLIFENARQKQENQIKAIRSFISQQVDYIVFSPIAEQGWDTVLQEAKEAGIPVILMDRQLQVADDSLYTAWVGSNFEAEGESAGHWLEDYLVSQSREEEEINIVVLQGTEGATSAIGRTEGFEKVAAEHPNWNILEQTNGEYTTAKGYEVMESMINRYETVDVVVSQNDDMTFGALQALEQAGMTTGAEGDVIVISFDAVKAALELVQQGIINVDIECNPLQGEKIREIILALEQGQTVERYCYVEEKIFTPENVAEYIDGRMY